VDTHSVRYVSWHERLAYCRWLTEILRSWEGTPEPLGSLLREDGWCITLPSEAEWEKAARGGLPSPGDRGGAGGGVLYPWGNDPDPNRANYDDTGIGTTSAVGCFPGGASPYGVEELSGNVYEWTRSHYKKYPYDAGDGREDLEAGDEARRVVRGGALFFSRRIVRCAFPLRRSEPPLQLHRFSLCGVPRLLWHSGALIRWCSGKSETLGGGCGGKERPPTAPQARSSALWRVKSLTQRRREAEAQRFLTHAKAQRTLRDHKRISSRINAPETGAESEIAGSYKFTNPKVLYVWLECAFIVPGTTCPFFFAPLAALRELSLSLCSRWIVKSSGSRCARDGDLAIPYEH